MPYCIFSSPFILTLEKLEIVCTCVIHLRLSCHRPHTKPRVSSARVRGSGVLQPHQHLKNQEFDFFIKL